MQLEAICIASMSSIVGADSRPLIKCGGPGPDSVSVACNDLENEKITGIVSFGIAGGMDPKLRSGSVLLPKAVVTAEGAFFQTDDIDLYLYLLADSLNFLKYPIHLKINEIIDNLLFPLVYLK